MISVDAEHKDGALGMTSLSYMVTATGFRCRMMSPG